MARATRDSTPLEWVGVFADAESREVAEHARALELDAVQLHGREPTEEIATVRGMIPEQCQVWKAVRVRDRISPDPVAGAQRILLDTWEPGKKGGTGQCS